VLHDEGETDEESVVEKLRHKSFDVIITKIACGKDNTALVTDEGFVFMMGSNKYGKLGVGLTEEQCPFLDTPKLLEAI